LSKSRSSSLVHLSVGMALARSGRDSCKLNISSVFVLLSMEVKILIQSTGLATLDSLPSFLPSSPIVLNLTHNYQSRDRERVQQRQEANAAHCSSNRNVREEPTVRNRSWGAKHTRYGIPLTIHCSTSIRIMKYIAVGRTVSLKEFATSILMTRNHLLRSVYFYLMLHCAINITPLFTHLKELT
jgi:hypothetical protein